MKYKICEYIIFCLFLSLMFVAVCPLAAGVSNLITAKLSITLYVCVGVMVEVNVFFCQRSMINI